MKYGLQSRVALIGTLLFLAVAGLTLVMIRHFSAETARDLGSKYARENAMRYAEKIKGTIDFDLILTRKLARNPDVEAWAQREEDPALRKAVFALLNDYLDVSKAGSWFIAFEASGRYYFNDAAGSYRGREWIKTLSPKNPDDRWFYHTLQSPDPYNLNVDFDEALRQTKLWLNIPIVKNGERLGVMGVGFDYTRFIDDYITQDKRGFTTMILNDGGAIIAHKEKRYVNYRSEMTDASQWTTLMSIVDPGHNERELPGYLERLSRHQAPWVSFDLYLGGHHYIASATYLPQLKWINLSMVDLDNVLGVGEMALIALCFIVLTLVAWGAIHWVNTRYLIRPIRSMSETARRVRDGDYSVPPECDPGRDDEIGELCRDIREMAVQIGRSARHAQEQYRWLADNTSDVIWILEPDGSFVYISPSVERMRGFTPEEVMAGSMDAVISPGSREIVRKTIAEALAEAAAGQTPQIKTIVIEQPRKDGSTVWTEANARLVLDKQGKPLRFIGSTRDITERIKAEEDIRKLAFYDPLTGLANRRLLLDRLQQAILSIRRNRSLLGLIYLDLDNFKPLNDGFGHEAGDELLIEAAKRIRGCLRATDTAARFGGDEFVVLLGDLGSERDTGLEHTRIVAEKIQQALSLPYRLKQTSYSLTASVGFHAFGEEVGETHDAISVVDQLMYRAKAAVRQGKGTVTPPSE